MADITLMGATYTDVPAVTLPSSTPGETVTFYENGGGGTDLSIIAPVFAEATANDAGTYVTYTDGKLYLLPDGHTANTTWANTTKTEVTVGSELCDIKADIDEIDGVLHGEQVIETMAVNPDSAWAVGGAQASVGNQIAFSSSSSYSHTYYNISENDISYTVTTKQSTSSNYPKYIHFVNNSGTVLSAVGDMVATAGFVTYSDIPIPNGAVKMYVTINSSQPAQAASYAVSKKYYGANEPGIIGVVEQLQTSVGEPEYKIKTVPNKNIVQGGVKGEAGNSLTTTTTSSYYNVKVDVDAAAEEYTIQTKQSTSTNYAHYFWFLNDNNVILTAGGEVKSAEGSYTYTASVPTGAKSLVVLTAGSYENIRIEKEIVVSLNDTVKSIEHYFDKKGLNTSPYADQQKDVGRAAVFDHNLSHKYLNFAFITDTHFGGTRYPDYDARNNIRAFVEMANERWMDFAAHGGDIITDYGLTRDDAIKWMDDTLGLMGDIQIPLYIAKGNHDANNAYYALVTDTSNLDWANTNYYVRNGIGFTQITQSQWDGEEDLYVENLQPERISDVQFTMLAQFGFAGDVIRDSNDYMGGYFYKDFPREKIRVIVLDEYQIQNGSWVGMTAEQVLWLGDTALQLGTNTDYEVMIISHSPNASADVVGLITAFKAGSTYTSNGHTYSFTSQGAGTFIMYLHGHEHYDSVDTSNGFNNIGVICGYVPVTAVDTEDEIRFSVFTIDTTAKKIYETRIGYGSNREFTY